MQLSYPQRLGVGEGAYTLLCIMKMQGWDFDMCIARATANPKRTQMYTRRFVLVHAHVTYARMTTAKTHIDPQVRLGRVSRPRRQPSQFGGLSAVGTSSGAMGSQVSDGVVK